MKLYAMKVQMLHINKRQNAHQIGKNLLIIIRKNKEVWSSMALSLQQQLNLNLQLIVTMKTHFLYFTLKHLSEDVYDESECSADNVSIAFNYHSQYKSRG